MIPISMPNDKTKRGLGCGGCLLVVIGLFASWRGCDKVEDYIDEREQEQQQEEQDEKRRAIEADVMKFAEDQAPALKNALGELDALLVRDRERQQKLGDTLAALGRDGQQDEDYRRIRSRIEEVEGKREALKRQLEEAYLLWQKFLISQDPQEQQRYQSSLQSGEQAARQTTARLKDLLRESGD